MAELTVEMTYGKALFDAACEAGKAETLLADAEEVIKVFREDPDFYEFFCTPVISIAEKKAVIGEVFDGKICPELLHLMYVLIDKRRGRNYIKIIDQYRKLLNENQGFASGEIYSAVPLSAGQLAEFEAQTGRLLQKRVKLDNKIRASLIGGIQIFIEGKVIDASVRKRLTDMKESLS